MSEENLTNAEETNNKFTEALDRLLNTSAEFTETVIERESQLVGIIVYLMHKHRYDQLTIPEAHHRDACQSKGIHLEFDGDAETLKVFVVSKPQNYDEFVAETAPAPDPRSEFFQLATDITRAHADSLSILPAIDSNVV